jgi:tRNA(Ile)-lysidine synthetase-like protein
VEGRAGDAPLAVSPLAQRVQGRLEALGVAPGDGLAVGVSGGGDSVALLCVLGELRAACGYRLVAVHVHHGVRGAQADEDATFTQEVAARLGVPVRVVRVDAPGAARKRGMGLEEAARHLRREALERVRQEEGLSWVVLAHHAQDQAETLLLRLVRGSGTLGLGGMSPREGKVLRPFLEESRQVLRAYLRDKGQPWREDESNLDMAFLRNRLRHTVLPRLEEAWPGAICRMGRSARLLREDGELLLSGALSQVGLPLVGNHSPAVGIPWEIWRAASVPWRRWLLRAAICRLSLPFPSLAFAQAWADYPEAAHPRPAHPGLAISRDARALWLFRAPAASTPQPLPSAPAYLALEEVGVLEVAPAFRCPKPLDPWHAHVLEGEGWWVRRWRPGDRTPDGRPVVRLLAQAGVPAPLRPTAWVVAQGQGTGEGSTVAWVPGAGPFPAQEEGPLPKAYGWHASSPASAPQGRCLRFHPAPHPPPGGDAGVPPGVPFVPTGGMLV